MTLETLLDKLTSDESLTSNDFIDIDPSDYLLILITALTHNNASAAFAIYHHATDEQKTMLLNKLTGALRIDLLMAAVIHGETLIIRALITNHGLNPNHLITLSRDGQDYEVPILTTAIEHSKLDSVDTLLALGADPNATFLDLTMLSCAAISYSKAGDDNTKADALDIFEQLLAHPDIDVDTDPGRGCVLEVCISDASDLLVKRLLTAEHDIDLDRRIGNNLTPPEYAYDLLHDLIIERRPTPDQLIHLGALVTIERLLLEHHAIASTPYIEKIINTALVLPNLDLLHALLQYQRPECLLHIPMFALNALLEMWSREGGGYDPYQEEALGVLYTSGVALQGANHVHTLFSGPLKTLSKTHALKLRRTVSLTLDQVRTADSSHAGSAQTFPAVSLERPPSPDQEAAIQFLLRSAHRRDNDDVIEALLKCVYPKTLKRQVHSNHTDHLDETSNDKRPTSAEAITLASADITEAAIGKLMEICLKYNCTHLLLELFENVESLSIELIHPNSYQLFYTAFTFAPQLHRRVTHQAKKTVVEKAARTKHPAASRDLARLFLGNAGFCAALLGLSNFPARIITILTETAEGHRQLRELEDTNEHLQAYYLRTNPRWLAKTYLPNATLFTKNKKLTITLPAETASHLIDGAPTEIASHDLLRALHKTLKSCGYQVTQDGRTLQVKPKKKNMPFTSQRALLDRFHAAVSQPESEREINACKKARSTFDTKKTALMKSISGRIRGLEQAQANLTLARTACDALQEPNRFVDKINALKAAIEQAQQQLRDTKTNIQTLAPRDEIDALKKAKNKLQEWKTHLPETNAHQKNAKKLLAKIAQLADTQAMESSDTTGEYINSSDSSAVLPPPEDTPNRCALAEIEETDWKTIRPGATPTVIGDAEPITLHRLSANTHGLLSQSPLAKTRPDKTDNVWWTLTF